MAKIELRPLSIQDGHLVYRMLQRIPAHENGFYNAANGLSYDQYKNWLKQRVEAEQGIGLEENEVEESIYWLVLNDIPIGIGKLRHRLTPHLKMYGGSIAYCIMPKYRGYGYGTVLLAMLLQQARTLALPEVLLVIYNYNLASERVIQKNGGVLYNKTELRSYYYFSPS